MAKIKTKITKRKIFYRLSHGKMKQIFFNSPITKSTLNNRKYFITIITQICYNLLV